MLSSLRSYISLVHAGYVMAREGVISSLPTDGMPGPAKFAHRVSSLIARHRAKDLEQSEKLSIALNKLGPSWVKLGQFLATRPDVVGAQTAKDLSLLHDSVAPFSIEEAKSRIAQSLGREIDEIYSEFSEPIAAASVAQVHKATLRETGEEVAVKVIRPGVRARFKKDLETFYAAGDILNRFVAEAERLKPISVVDMLSQSAKIEMDLRLEAAAFSEMHENTESDEGFRVPSINWEFTGRDCITMDWIDGTKMSDIEGLREAGHDLEALSVAIIQAFLRHTLRDGFFHADMHPGNLFVDAKGDIVAVDLGIAGRLSKKGAAVSLQKSCMALSSAIICVSRRFISMQAMCRPHHDVHSFAQAIRAIGEPIHGQSAETISMAKLLTLLFEVTEIFDMQTRPELLLLQKTMVVVEGVARTLNPSFNMWKSAEPVVGSWIAKNLGPVGILEDAKEGLEAARHIIHVLPDLAKKTEELSLEMESMVRNGMKLDPQTTEAIGKAEAKNNRWGSPGNLGARCIGYLLGIWRLNREI